MTIEEKLIDEIFRVFPAEREYEFAPLVNSSQGEEPYATADAFRDKDDWTKLDGEWVDQAADGWATALNFLSDEAACFYLPAYLVADIRGLLQSSDPVFQLTHGLRRETQANLTGGANEMDWGDYTRRRWRSLSPGQALAVKHYLEWRRSQDSDNLFSEIGEALSAYWNVHSAW